MGDSARRRGQEPRARRTRWGRFGKGRADSAGRSGTKLQGRRRAPFADMRLEGEGEGNRSRAPTHSRHQHTIRSGLQLSLRTKTSQITSCNHVEEIENLQRENKFTSIDHVQRENEFSAAAAGGNEFQER